MFSLEAEWRAVEAWPSPIRRRRPWPRARITLRGDSGFARGALMAWCEANRVDYVAV